MTKTLLLGQTLSFSGNPFDTAWTDVTQHTTHGAVLIEGGKITAIGEADGLRALNPGAEVHDYGSALITAGFVDAHMHYPQTAIPRSLVV